MISDVRLRVHCDVWPSRPPWTVLRRWRVRTRRSVVIRGRRGLELGEVLGESVPLEDEYVGELVRTADEADRTAAARMGDNARRLCTAAEAAAAELALPLTVLDAEVMLDGCSAVLHGLTHAPCDAGPLLAASAKPTA